MGVDRLALASPLDAASAALEDTPYVLIVGDSTEARAVVQVLTRARLHYRYAVSLHAAQQLIDTAVPAVAIIELDVAHTDALDLCRQMKRDSASRLVPVVMLSDDRERGHRLAGIEAGAEALLSKPFDPEELIARVRAFSRVSQYTGDLDSAAAIIMTITAMSEARECAPGHCYRMANYATALGRAMHLSDADLKALYRGAFLHDIGMLAIPDVILRKDGQLAPEEYEVIKSHPVVGDTLCANLRTLHAVRPIVRHHHERLDGSGYPDGLRGDEVPLLAQIVSTVDVFEAMTTGRDYVAPRSAPDAIAVLWKEVKLGWRSHDLVEHFAALVASGDLEKFRGQRDDLPGELATMGSRPLDVMPVPLAAAG